MLDGLRHWLAIGRMQRRKRRTIKAYAKDLAAAKKAGNPKREDILREEHEELRFIDDEIGIEESQRLCRQAGSLQDTRAACRGRLGRVQNLREEVLDQVRGLEASHRPAHRTESQMGLLGNKDKPARKHHRHYRRYHGRAGLL
jgi:hypothetical protein